MGIYYLDDALHATHRKAIISRVVSQLKNVEFDAIAFRGLSGALVAPIIAEKMGKHLVGVRISTTYTHSDNRDVEVSSGLGGDFRFVIVDDLIDSGRTVRSIIDKIHGEHPDAKCVAIVTYHRYVADPEGGAKFNGIPHLDATRDMPESKPQKAQGRLSRFWCE